MKLQRTNVYICKTSQYMHKHDNYDNLHYYIKQTLYKGSVSLNENGVN